MIELEKAASATNANLRQPVVWREVPVVMPESSNAVSFLTFTPAV